MPTRQKMEAAFDSDFSRIRVHRLDAAGTLRARGLTRGEHIHLEPAAMDLTSVSTHGLLGEELAHTIQQRQGRVAGTLGAMSVNVDPALEQEAKNAGTLAARGERALVGALSAPAATGVIADVVQGNWFTDWLWSLWGQPAVPTVPVYIPPPTGFVRTLGTGLSETIETPPDARSTAFDDAWASRGAASQGDREYYIPKMMTRLDLSFDELLLGVQRDLQRMLAIMLDKDRFEALLAPLDGLVGEIRNESGKSGLAALKAYEREFGFSLNQVIPLSVLPGPIFPRYLGSQGVVPKDLGAGLPHGEMSHRLQWIAIMQDFNNGPENWLLTPLDLLTLLNKNRFGWVQGIVMDQAAHAPHEAYTHPDNVLRFMRDDTDTKARLPNLSKAIVERWDKRVNAAVDALNTGKGFNLDPALNTAYAEKKQATGWAVESGVHEGTTWKVLNPPEEKKVDEGTLEERLAKQRSKWGK